MVKRLRKSINQGVLSDPIRTVVGLGYKFSEFFEEQHLEWPAPRKKGAVAAAENMRSKNNTCSPLRFGEPRGQNAAPTSSNQKRVLG